MSITAISWAMQLEVGSPTLKFVLIAVANYADEDGRCWPSQERLAKDTELTDRCIRDALRKLEERGFIARTDRFVSGNKRQTDIIQLNFSHRNEIPMAESGHRNVVPVEPPERHSESHRNVIPKPPEPRSAKPSIEPSEEEPSDTPSLRSGAARKQAAQAVVVPIRPKAKPPPERGRRLPADFQLTVADIEVARKEGFTDEQIRREFDKFRDHWLSASGPNSIKRDWHAAWRNWIRKAAESFGSPVRAASGGRGTSADGWLGAAQRAAARFRNTDDYPE